MSQIIKANLVLTDPPYNVDFKGSSGLKIKNDSQKSEQFYGFLLSAFRNLADSLESGGSAYIFHADTEGENFRRAFREAGFHLSGTCIWVKDSFVMGRSPYQWQHESILYGWLKTGTHKWYAGRSEATVWNFAKPKKNSDHPTSKPLDLLAYPIRNSSQANGIVLDTFGGSGSTLIACEHRTVKRNTRARTNFSKCSKTGGFKRLLFPYRCAVYSTHSHTPEAPRLRVVIPLSRDVNPDEYAALSRLVVEEIGMDFFDDSTYEPERLMYWPSVPSDGEYVFKIIGGDELNPDKYLAKLSDWRDCSLWPTSSRQSEIIRRSIRLQQDPLTKDGAVGAFCRAYSIEDAIKTFLSDVYEPSAMAGRYDYIPADSSAGVVFYDGKWAYSHHATDPACGKLLNAFDLVRIHKFSDFDEKAGFKAMCGFAVEDEKVRVLMAEERIAAAEEDFPQDENWAAALEREKSGVLKNTLGNLLLILNRDEHLAGIRYNRLANQIYGENLPWERPHEPWRDADTAQLVAYIDKRYGTFSARNYELALTKAADDRAYHPIREYLNGLPAWDRIPRIDTLLIDYLGAEDTPYVRAVTRKTLVAAVARIKRPGTKHDSILVLNGRQGIGKSTLFARLGGKWYSDSLSISDMKDKTAPEKLQGYWILELGELVGIKKMDVETVKSFITRTDDKYRPSYGRAVESHPRQCVIVGTTNSDGGFLRDITGNRRFWPVRVTGNGTKHPWELSDIDQIWAEALVRYAEGEELYLTGELAAAAFAE
jgi:putative DNA primase/helicase